MSAVSPGARARGGATGLLTGALAVAAHGMAGGAMPTGAAAAMLALLAVTVGAVAATVASAAKPTVLAGILGAGQLAGHLVLSVAEHRHAVSTAPPAAVMLAAHAVAIGLGALLIAAGEHLWQALSRAVRCVARAVLPVAGTPVVAVRGSDQPLHSALFLAASVSHRGPPVSLAP